MPCVLPVRAFSRLTRRTLRSARFGRTREPLVMTLAPGGAGQQRDQRAPARRARGERASARPLPVAPRGDDGGADRRAGCDERAGPRRRRLGPLASTSTRTATPSPGRAPHRLVRVADAGGRGY